MIGLYSDMSRTDTMPELDDADETETFMTEARNPVKPPVENHILDVLGPDRKIVEKTITGRLIGSASSEQEYHEDHEDEWAPRNFRCPRCRWMEVDIYSDVTDGNQTYAYLVHTVGRSDVPTESDRPRFIPAFNAMMVVGGLVSRQRDARPHLTVAASSALFQAAIHSPELTDEIRTRGII